METQNIETTTTHCPDSGQELNSNSDNCGCGNKWSSESKIQTSLDTEISEPVEETSNGASDMLYGALWCIGGIVFTAVTYSAVKETGGTYYIAWGAIVFGGYQFFKGLVHSLG